MSSSEFGPTRSKVKRRLSIRGSSVRLFFNRPSLLAADSIGQNPRASRHDVVSRHLSASYSDRACCTTDKSSSASAHCSSRS